MERRVLYDEIEPVPRMANQPPPSIVNDDIDLGIREHACDLWILRDEPKVSWIDFDDGKTFDVFGARDDLRPRSRGQADHQYGAGIWMERDGTERAHDDVAIIDEIRGDRTVIRS